MTIRPSLLIPGYLLRAHDEELERGAAVLVDSGLVADYGSREQMIERYPAAEKIELDDCILLPGLVNAHQHGRGVSQIQLGYPDQRLELWMAQRRARNCPDLYASGRLAAAEMLRNGVTCAVHADLAYGSGDYEAELRNSTAAYVDSGMRTCVAVGVCDQGNIVFPQAREAAFLSGLPTDISQRLSERNGPPYAADFPSTARLLDVLMRDFAGNDCVRFCYGPSGPQWVSDGLFAEVAADAKARNIGLHIHALETTGQYAACVELYPEGTIRHLDKLGAIGPKTVIAHGVFLTDDDIAVLGERQALVATNPGSNLRLCDSTAPLPKLFAAGVRVAVGSDNSSVMDDEDLFSEARVASLLSGRRNWSSPNRPSGRQVIEMLTTTGAAAAGFDGRLGRIERGWFADIAAISIRRTIGAYLDSDMPLIDALVARARGDDVRLTMIGGKVLYRDGSYAELDIEEIKCAASSTAERSRLPSNLHDVDITERLKPYLTEYYERLTAKTRFPDVLS